jgi:twitching motility protein PilT
VRTNGELNRIPDEISLPLNDQEILELFAECFTSEVMEDIRNGREIDLSFQFVENRYRANICRQQGYPTFALRIVPQQTMKLSELHLPSTLKDLVRDPRGLLMLTGPTGQGKSTTVRALLQEINESQSIRIITIEDPIEYVFQDSRAFFEQREVRVDTPTFADGIRNAMRQDPDVIFVGEIRDQESVFTAMQAAETGHLVLTTLHADSVAQAIGRIQEFYPVNEQQNIRNLLARNLNAIACQRLIPNIKGDRVPCLEIMKMDQGIEEAIQKNRLTLLADIMEISNNQGMHTFDQYLMELLIAEIIDEKTAKQYAVNQHKFDLELQGISPQQKILVREMR